jgi:hypothetical protein
VTSVIPATWEVEMKRTEIEGQSPAKNLMETPSQQIKLGVVGRAYQPHYLGVIRKTIVV